MLVVAYSRHLSRPLRPDYKSDASPVTEVDRIAHDMLQRGLQSMSPGVPVLSEEAVPAMARRQWSEYWLIDPLDGTRELLAGSAHFCFNIALIQGGRPVLGLIAIPMLGVAYVGGRDCRAVTARRDVRVPLRSRPATSGGWLKLLTSRRGLQDPGQRALRAVCRRRFPGLIVEVRGSAWKFCRIAEGAGHCYACFGETSEWDTAAGQALLEAVGGQVVDAAGRPLCYNARDSLVNPPFYALSPARFDWWTVLAAGV